MSCNTAAASWVQEHQVSNRGAHRKETQYRKARWMLLLVPSGTEQSSVIHFSQAQIKWNCRTAMMLCTAGTFAEIRA